MLPDYYLGKMHFDLVMEGMRTRGQIVDCKQKRMRNVSGTRAASLTFMPAVAPPNSRSQNRLSVLKNGKDLRLRQV